MKIAGWKMAAALLLLTGMAMAVPQNSASGSASSAPAQKNLRQPKTQAEYDAFQQAAVLTDAPRLEEAAIGFAQRFPDSNLRGYLFQQAMGLYQAAQNSDKTLEMARQVLKFEPENPVARLTAAQVLAERTPENALDRNDRLEEARADAQNALEHAGEIERPPSMTPAQFTEALAKIRGTAHEVIGTVAFKKQEYPVAIREYTAATREEQENTDAVVWLRLAVCHDKGGNPQQAMEAVEKAITFSAAGSPARELAMQEKSKLEQSGTVKDAAK